ncbi:MAG: prepilin-type N-terminal cleavage/methylation domain-containing protein [Dehalococcoidia bacterium]|nr:prepilin-type N-terminal cleavage/methylation domain-containing protein [Dehalococcoidia bacterium]
MVSTQKYLKFGARVVPTSMGRACARFTAFRRSVEGFTLVELLAVMAIIAILAGVTAGAVTGLGGQGINAQILSDASAMETAADRFLNASFPETFPVSALPSGEEDLGVRAIDFDARLPQDPSQTFVPDFLKKIPDSAALVSFRIDIGTGRIFTADDGAAFAPPSDSRFDASFSDTTPLGNPVVTFTLKMGGNRAALKKLRVVGPGGFALGGRTLPAGSKVGTLQITFGTDNIWQSGHEIGVDADILATGRAHEWEMIPIYSGAISDADNSPVSGVKEGVTSLTHSFTIGASGTAGVPGKLFIEMDRTGLTKAHNEATETWIITIFDKARDSAGDVIIPEERLVTNPSVSKVYRWLTEEHTTIQVVDIFSAVAGRLAVVIKDPAASATSTPEPTPSTPSPSPTPPPTPTNTPPVVTVSGPTTGSASAPTPNLEFTATVVDDNDNSTTLESALVWFIDGEPAGTIGPTLLSPGLQLGLKDPAVPVEGPHTIRAFSLDSGSLTGVGTLIITLSP